LYVSYALHGGIGMTDELGVRGHLHVPVIGVARSSATRPLWADVTAALGTAFQTP